jgi:hypothetical protein
MEHHSGSSWAGGGGIYVYYVGRGENSNPSPKIYNNLIIGNKSADRGGGMAVYYWEKPKPADIHIRPLVFNNTFIDNFALTPGIDIIASKPLLVNNFFWDSLSKPGVNEIVLDAGAVYLYHNNIQGPVSPVNGNISIRPCFSDDLFMLCEGDASIGAGIDSVFAEGEWYTISKADYDGITRPDSIDNLVDIGAFESPFISKWYTEARLSDLGVDVGSLNELFNPDVYEYDFAVPCHKDSLPEISYLAMNPHASMEVFPAKKLIGTESERTTTIKVTPPAGDTIQKTYELVFKSQSTMSLDYYADSIQLCESIKVLPSNNGMVYLVPAGTSASPPEIQQASIVDGVSMDGDTIFITTSGFILDTINYDLYGLCHNKFVSPKAQVKILPSSGPELTLHTPEVDKGNYVRYESDHDGKIYLVPAETEAKIAVIRRAAIDSANTTGNNIALLSTSALNPSTYWLYASDNCGRISEAKSTLIIGIKDHLSGSVKIYPIPVTDILYIETDHAIKSLNIYNVTGIEMSAELTNPNSVDLSHLEQGIYFIRIETINGGIFTARVIKK